MLKYKIKMYWKVEEEFEIEADNEAEALDNAMCEGDIYLTGRDYIEEYDNAEVEEK